MRSVIIMLGATAILGSAAAYADMDVNMPEARALWVARWSITSPEKARRVVELSKKYGYNVLFVQVRGRGDAFYRSNFEPRAEDLEGQPLDFDPLAIILEEGHRQGIQMHAWLNTHFTWGASSRPTSPEHIVNKHPDWLMRNIENEITYTATGESEGAYTCPSNPEVKEFVKNVFLDVAKNYDVDGLHFDFVRYPSADYCYCNGCMQRFKEHIDRTLSPEERAVISNFPSRIAYTLAFPHKWDVWRRQQITDLVTSVYREAKRLKPRLAISAAVFPSWEDAYNHRFQDWKRWLAESLLDFICPMAYGEKTETVEGQIRDAVAAAGKIPVYAGIGSWYQSVDSTVEKIEHVRSAGARGIVLFSYGAITAEGTKEDYLKAVQERAFLNAR